MKGIRLFKILLPFLFFCLLYVLVKIEVIPIPGFLTTETEVQMSAQNPPFRGLGKDTLEEEFKVFGEDSPFPHRLGDMHLVKVIKGEEALDNVRSFQGTDINIVRAFIPHYQTGNRQAIIWITESYSEQCAKDLIERMSINIPENENFHNFNIIYTRGIKVYKAERMGWFNYFYQKETGVYWVSIQDDNPVEVLYLVLDQI